MTNEEKDKLLDYLERQIDYVNSDDDYVEGKNYAYRDIHEYIEPMQIIETKETNLKHFKDDLLEYVSTPLNKGFAEVGLEISGEFKDYLEMIFKLGASLIEAYLEYTGNDSTSIEEIIDWYLEPYCGKHMEHTESEKNGE